MLEVNFANGLDQDQARLFQIKMDKRLTWPASKQFENVSIFLIKKRQFIMHVSISFTGFVPKEFEVEVRPYDSCPAKMIIYDLENDKEVHR